jgi:hypothetical protein
LNGIWQFPEKMGQGQGFVYIVRDNIMKHYYIGRKNFRGRSDQRLDWKNYRTSSEYLQKHFAERPTSEFDFIVLEVYHTPCGLSYAETWSLCAVKAPERSDFINRRVERLLCKSKEIITDRHQNRLMEAV